MIYEDLVSWVARNQVFDLRNYVLIKFPISFGLFFYENNTVKLIIHYAVCKRIAATYGQLLFTKIEKLSFFHSS